SSISSLSSSCSFLFAASFFSFLSALLLSCPSRSSFLAFSINSFLHLCLSPPVHLFLLTSPLPFFTQTRTYFPYSIQTILHNCVVVHLSESRPRDVERLFAVYSFRCVDQTD
ncbi:hypothetical protein PFISCL1PPCAC_21351, partial [Pristionchus fissidentatus]